MPVTWRTPQEQSAKRLRVTDMMTSWIFFFAAMAFGVSSILSYYLLVWRLMSKGIRVKFFATPRDTLRVFRQYRGLAPENRWALWPIAAFWLFSLLCFMSMAAFAYADSSHAFEGGMPWLWLHARLAMLWIMASSFLIGLVFSYRVFSDTSEQDIKLSNWKAWISDEYTRNDFFVATIGWVGFLTASLQLIMGNGR